MSQRDRDARAAMREVIRATLTGDIDGPFSPADVASDAWNYADAMEAERVRRDQAEAPEMPESAPVRDDERAKVKEACEKAHREGRDAGLREAVDYVWRRRKDTSIHCQIERSTLESIRDGIAALISKTPAPAPDLASLQAENAKLRAVAEAAAEVAQGRSACLLDALDAAMPGWRTKEAP